MRIPLGTIYVPKGSFLLCDLVLELIAPLPGTHVNISFHTPALGIQIIFPL